MQAPRLLRSLNRQIDELVERTPAERDRVVDALRAVSILVVILWHWSLSVLHRTNGLGMPNPLDQLPGSWIATWFLQIMPVFFFVGGFANLATWPPGNRYTGRAGRGGTSTRGEPGGCSRPWRSSWASGA